jgi:hypothetical protein
MDYIMSILRSLALVLPFGTAFLLCAGLQAADNERRTPASGIYYTVDQGVTWGILKDQRMSNLIYQGPGAVLNFGRRAQWSSFISEWHVVRLQYNNSRPSHANTIVANPGVGFRYLQLRRLYTPGTHDIYAGAQALVTGNFRIAPRLGNSYLFADMIAEVRPHAELYFQSRFLWRDWNLEFSFAASMLGYTVRIPEYGVSFELDEHGGTRIQGYEQQWLTPLNYARVSTGIFIRESFTGSNNSNWFRVGYVWDYSTMAGAHNLNLNNALHQLVLELYFRVR